MANIFGKKNLMEMVLENQDKERDAQRTYDFGRKAHRRDAGFDFMMDRKRDRAGISRGGRPAAKSVAQAIMEREPKYPSPDALPREANGMDLDSATFDPRTREWAGKYVHYDPTDGQDTVAKVPVPGPSFDPLDTALKVGGKVTDFYKGMYGGLANKLGLALSGRDGKAAGNPSGARRAEAPPSDYESMSEDELYTLASQGDRQAQEVGKRRFRA